MLLYNGQVSLEFDPIKHKYLITDGDEEPFHPPTVTAITGIMDKPWLVPWAANKAVELCAGAIAPDTPYSNVYLEAVWANAKRGYRKIREQAAATGTKVHEFLEGYFKSTEKPVLPPEGSEVRRSVDAALAWLADHRVEPICIERRVYSREFRCAGTLDKLAYVDGQISLIDWKTSKGIYPEYRLQTAAYQGFYEEETGTQIEKRWLIRLGKEDGIFEAHEFPREDYIDDYLAFVRALRLYQWAKEANKGE